MSTIILATLYSVSQSLFNIACRCDLAADCFMWLAVLAQMTFTTCFHGCLSSVWRQPLRWYAASEGIKWHPTCSSQLCGWPRQDACSHDRYYCLGDQKVVSVRSHAVACHAARGISLLTWHKKVFEM